MKISEYHNTLVSYDVKRTPLKTVDKGRKNKGIRSAWAEDKRFAAEDRQQQYNHEFRGNHPQVGPVLRAGRKLREGEL